MRHTAVFTCTTPRAREIHEVLVPEIGEINPRTEVGITLEGTDQLVISVAAEDVPALRAALNMWLRLVSVAAEMLETAGAGK
ncbi:MAG TPA: KEOPS complex subunit Pcc1 [Methanomicrobiales archaeon]|nr:KEOPS complex subunit Pcc1 [Methanomicrobiales archaeon]